MSAIGSRGIALVRQAKHGSRRPEPSEHEFAYWNKFRWAPSCEFAGGQDCASFGLESIAAERLKLNPLAHLLAR